MIPRALAAVLLVGPALAWAQYPAGYYGGGYGGGTAAGNAMQGMASVISAKGDYNLSTSAAAINMTQAQREYIYNRQQATDAYFQMRAANKSYTAAERGAPPTPEQLARISREAGPKPLTSRDIDPVNGRVNWPPLLQDDRYASGRNELQELVVKQVSYGALGLNDQTKAHDTIENIFADLKSRIREVPSQQYVIARTFLRSLIYAMSQTDL